MNAILRSGFLALAIVLALAVPKNAIPMDWRQECKTELKEVKKLIDEKRKGKYLFEAKHRRKAMQYYNNAIAAHYNKQYIDCAHITLLITSNLIATKRGIKPDW